MAPAIDVVDVTPTTTFALQKELVDGYEISTKPDSPIKLKKQMSAYLARQNEDKAGSMDMKTYYYHAYAASVASQEGKCFAITGCSTGTGYTLARTLVEKRAQVIVLNRPSGRHDLAMSKLTDLSQKHGAPAPVAIPCDLTHFDSVRKAGADLLAACTTTGLDGLINNAGVMGFADEATVDGCDVQMQTNHLSHFLLTSICMPALEMAAAQRGEARIVNHSSCARAINATGASKGWDNHLKPEYLSNKRGGNLGGSHAGMMTGANYERYQQTKLANVVFTYALRDRLAAKGSRVKALVAHPGVAPTSLMLNTMVGSGDTSMLALPQCLSKLFLKWLMHSQEDGTMGLLMCACEPSVASGDFYGPYGKGLSGVHDTHAYKGKAVLMPEEPLADEAARKMLWEESETSTGVTFAI